MEIIRKGPMNPGLHAVRLQAGAADQQGFWVGEES